MLAEYIIGSYSGFAGFASDCMEVCFGLYGGLLRVFCELLLTQKLGY